MILISLIGEQPAPNLLPTRHLQPQASVLVYTERTQRTAERLQAILTANCACQILPVEGYEITDMQHKLNTFLDKNYQGETLVFNLTGGTKPMSLAAFLVAQARKAAVIYFQSEGNRSRLVTYNWHDIILQKTSDEELPQDISLADYLHLYLGKYEVGDPRDKFEQEIHDILKEISGLECLTSVKPQGLGALEIDFVFRYGNQIAICEAKRKGAKEGIDQLNAVANPRYLGTYIHKFLCSGREVDKNNRDLAAAYNINIIQLPSYGMNNVLSAEDKSTLKEAVLKRMVR
ncbi:MAG: DUF1887 family protein [Caldilineaceae bacterium]|nr:DUF1887 family protein [Caldilineaceae bacterium]